MKKILVLVVSLVLITIIVLLGLYLKRAKFCPVSSKEGSEVSLSGLSLTLKDLEAKGRLLELKNTYQKLINSYPNSRDVLNWQKKAEEINTKLLFSPVITPKSIFYQVKQGDTLTSIARQFKTTVELVKKSNNLSDDKILLLKKIKIWTAPFSIVVDKSQNTLVLKSEEEIFKTYIVSTGLNNSTPIGNYKIVNKIPNPTWYKAGTVVPADSPENVLGSRWLGFDLAGYGIHGTTEPQNLGKQVTQGCVRLSNSDVEELYTIIPIGTEVTIVD